MGRHNSKSAERATSVSEFYDLLSTDYDAMTGFEKRFVVERPFFRLLVDRFRIRTALDAGCGTGFHALALSELGVCVTAVDVSAHMVRLASRHARSRGLKIETLVASFEELDAKLEKRFNAVFVMGNSLPHLIEPDSLRRAVRNFFNLLEPGGLLFTQLLNYERILQHREHVQSVRETDQKTFVRTYEYDQEGILFTITSRNKSGGQPDERSQSIRLVPLQRSDLAGVLGQSGFAEQKFFGGISMEPFDPAASKDLVILARKPS